MEKKKGGGRREGELVGVRRMYEEQVSKTKKENIFFLFLFFKNLREGGEREFNKLPPPKEEEGWPVSLFTLCLKQPKHPCSPPPPLAQTGGSYSALN